MARTITTTSNIDYDTWSKLAMTRSNIAKLRKRAIALECEGNYEVATKFMSLADCAEAVCDREQLRLAITR